MKWLSILRDKTGKFKMGIPQLAGIAGTGILLSYGAFEADKAADPPQVRSLAAIEDTVDYSGMTRDASGNLSSVRLRDSRNQIATREERERLNGGSGNNDFGLNAVAGLEGRMNGGSYGQAAQTGASEGLGMGANAAYEVGASGAAGRYGYSQNGAAGGAQALSREGQAESRAAAGDNGAHQLAAASMATASGNAFNAAAGAISGSGPSGSTAGGSSGKPGGNYEFSGFMPPSSSALAALSDNGQRNVTNSSNFLAASRRGTSGRGTRSNTQGDLKDISKRSADIAKNKFRSANEGSRAFLAAATNSAGMTIEGGVDTVTTGSADFQTPEVGALKKLQAKKQEADDFYKKQKKARERLQWMTIALILLTVAAIYIAVPWIATSTKSVLGAPLAELAWLVLGIPMLFAVVVGAFAADYMNTYNGKFMPMMAIGISVGAIAGCLYAGLKAKASAAAGIAAAEKFKAGATAAAAKVGVGVGGMAAESAYSAMEQKDAEAMQKNPKNAK